VELPGSGYLYALATVSITFVGFSALLIVFRQSVDGELTSYDTYFTLSFIQIGFIVTLGALLPPMLALYGWEPFAVWRSASVLVAIPLVWFVATVPSRRRRATGSPVPLFIMTLLGLQGAAAVVLLLTAAGVFAGSEAGVYASAVTTVLITSGIAYLMALQLTLPGITKK
jgi:hypothetical protein